MVKTQPGALWARPTSLLLATLLLVVLAFALAACDVGGTEPPPGPPGPPTAGPSPTPVPTETPITVTGSGAELYGQAHTAMQALKSYHFVTDSDLGRGATQHIEGDWVAPDRLRMTTVNKGAGTDGTQHTLRIGAEQWSRKSDAEAWAKAAAQAGSIGPDQTAGVLRYAATVDKTDDKALDGQTLLHMTFGLDPAKLAGSAAGISRGDGELWIDKTSKNIVQMQLNYTSSVTGAKGEAHSVMRLSKFDSAVEIAHP